MAVPIGCDKCNHTGYTGRIGIYELLRVDESIRTIIRTSGNIDQIRAISRSNGMRLMQEDALEKVLNRHDDTGRNPPGRAHGQHILCWNAQGAISTFFPRSTIARRAGRVARISPRPNRPLKEDWVPEEVR